MHLPTLLSSPPSGPLHRRPASPTSDPAAAEHASAQSRGAVAFSRNRRGADGRAPHRRPEARPAAISRVAVGVSEARGRSLTIARAVRLAPGFRGSNANARGSRPTLFFSSADATTTGSGGGSGGCRAEPVSGSVREETLPFFASSSRPASSGATTSPGTFAVASTRVSAETRAAARVSSPRPRTSPAEAAAAAGERLGVVPAPAGVARREAHQVATPPGRRRAYIASGGEPEQVATPGPATTG